MEKAIDLFKTVRAGLLIAGTTIGAGMLGIPLLTASLGFFPALLITVMVWVFMLATGLLLLEASLGIEEGGNFLSLSKAYLGPYGQAITGFLFVFLYYFLMIAYFAAGSSLLESLFGMQLSSGTNLFIFSSFFFLIVACGPVWIDRVNFVLTLAMGVLYVLLLLTGWMHISFNQLNQCSFGGLLGAAPVLFSAFGYHNIIPSLVTYLKKDVVALRRAIVLGTCIPLVVYLLWQMYIMGVVPMEILEEAKRSGAPVTHALKSITSNPWVFILGQGFAFLAIVTSVLGVSFSLVDFLADGLKMAREGISRIFLTFLTFFPPFLGALYNPGIFGKALGIAGGIGEGLINGIIPVALVWSLRYLYRKQNDYQVYGGKVALVCLFFFAALVIGIEIEHLVFG